MEPEESEEEFLSATATTINKQKKELNDDGMQNTSSWKPELSEFTIATLVFVCFLGIIFVGLGCVFLMILGWMSYAMFFLMAFGLVGCLVFLFMDPCSLMLAKRIRKRRRSSGNKNFGSWTEMISLAPKVRTSMKKNRRRKNTTTNKTETDQVSQPSPDPHVIRSSPSRPAPPPPLASTGSNT